jgi:ABC-type sugar transport system ATPase subunit
VPRRSAIAAAIAPTARTSMSMIFVAHNYANVLQPCDRVNLMEDGRIALDEPASQSVVEELMSRMTARVGRR